MGRRARTTWGDCPGRVVSRPRSGRPEARPCLSRGGCPGLGLAISREDARLHGGWLHAWGEPGVGSCFRLTLPRHTGVPIETSPLPLRPQEERSARSLASDPASIPVVAAGTGES